MTANKVLPPESAGFPSATARSAEWRCYILRCSDGTLYTGVTNDLERRIAAHNAGTAAKYTRSRGPVALAFVEVCDGKSAALKREMAIKSMPRTEKLALVETFRKNNRRNVRNRSPHQPVKAKRLTVSRRSTDTGRAGT
ncbi:MAG: GIY-YIG nuclease family protein [Nitrospinae bacterium]|nr:GIY-YIG nuclease family protein [Nitrospinota bacterium]